jgi:hypothetical protein
MANSEKIENRFLEEMNDLMKKYGVEEISFGKKHSVVKTKGKKAISKQK